MPHWDLLKPFAQIRLKLVLHALLSLLPLHSYSLLLLPGFYIKMAPIVSPKLLSQILMYGCAVEVCSAKYVGVCSSSSFHSLTRQQVKIAAVESRAQLIAVPDFIFGSVAPRQRRLLGPKLNKASYASLPNSNFVIDAEEVDLEMGVCEAPAAILQKSSSSLDLAPVNDETAPLVQEVRTYPADVFLRC